LSAASSATLAIAPSVTDEDIYVVDEVFMQRESISLAKSQSYSFNTNQEFFDQAFQVASFDQNCLEGDRLRSGKFLGSTPGGLLAALSEICTTEVFFNYFQELTSDAYIMPTSGIYTSGYGPRWSRHHAGIDIANHIGTPIKASRLGRVVFAGSLGAYGLMIDIEHIDGYVTRYAHCNELLVEVGDVVDQGDWIAKMGNTGRSTGPHLHFEVIAPSGNALDPIAFLGKRSLQEEV